MNPQNQLLMYTELIIVVFFNVMYNVSFYVCFYVSFKVGFYQKSILFLEFLISLGFYGFLMNF